MKAKWKISGISLKTSLTIWYVLMLFIVLIFFSLLLYFQMEKTLYQEVMSFLQIEVESINNELAGKNIKKQQRHFNDMYLSFSNKFNTLAFYNKSGELLLGDLKYDVIQKSIPASSFYKIVFGTESKWALISRPQVNNGEVTGYTLLARSLIHEETTLNNLLIIILFAVPVTLLIASGGGYFLADRALSPIDKISNTAREISCSNLSQRIEMKSRNNDEIARLTNILNQLLKRLEDAFHRQKQFTADASHELRTPIAVIRAQVEGVLDKENTSIDEYLQVMVVIKKQVVHMGNLIGQMLLLSRVDENKNHLEKESFNLNFLIETLMEEMEGLAQLKNIQLIKELGDEPLIINADQSLITQLLLNLIDNAIKYSISGGKVIIKVNGIDKNIRIDVIDEGPGIAEEHQSNIFERFYRIDKSRSRKNGGSGLGLAISRWIVEAHQGKISVKSEEGQGTIFTVYLPK